jgi:hypothetical protein
VDCARVTGKPQVIGLSVGLVPTNALAVTKFRDNPYRGHCYRRERAAAYGKLLKLRDTDGYLKRFQ